MLLYNRFIYYNRFMLLVSIYLLNVLKPGTQITQHCFPMNTITIPTKYSKSNWAEKISPGGLNIKQEPAATDKLKKTIIPSE